MVAANVSAGSAIYPAANFVQQINLAGGIAGDGFVDRYLPARDELELLWRHFKPITNNNYLAARGKPNPYVSDCNIDDVSSDGMGANRHAASSGQAYTGADPAQTALTVFRSGGDQALSTEVRYWSCSKSSVGYAWTQTYFAANPGWQRDHGHTNSFRVRAVRREIY
jgi:hypothetical protein